jgi:hypothetical protein
MVYLFEFLGLLLIGIALAASPQLIKLFEHLFPRVSGDGPVPGRASGVTLSNEGSELREEIRRVTELLEIDGRARRR